MISDSFLCVCQFILNIHVKDKSLINEKNQENGKICLGNMLKILHFQHENTHQSEDQDHSTINHG